MKEIIKEEPVIEELITCPECKNRLKFSIEITDGLGIKKGKMLCQKCSREYNIEDGIYDLRKIFEIYDDRGNEWSLDVFEEFYDSLPEYKNGKEWFKLLGYPEDLWRYMNPKVKGRILEMINLQNHEIILDVGCGVGYFLFQILEKNLDKEPLLIGLDIAFPNLRRFRNRCKNENLKNMVCILGDGQNLPLSDGVVDQIICSEVLEHVASPEIVISEMRRVLRNEGLLFISTPLSEGIKAWEILLMPLRLTKKIIRIIKKEKKIEEKGAYDVPITGKKIREILNKEGFKLQVLERNVLIPPEHYFKALPNNLTKIYLSFSDFIEKNLKPIFQMLGTHYVVKAKKQK